MRRARCGPPRAGCESAHSMREHGVKVEMARRPERRLFPERGACMTTLTEAVIRRVAPKARADIVAGLVTAQNELTAAGLNTKARLAHFIAQICTETGGLQHTEENL